jgi:hypothetical protein
LFLTKNKDDIQGYTRVFQILKNDPVIEAILDMNQFYKTNGIVKAQKGTAISDLYKSEKSKRKAFLNVSSDETLSTEKGLVIEKTKKKGAMSMNENIVLTHHGVDEESRTSPTHARATRIEDDQEEEHLRKIIAEENKNFDEQSFNMIVEKAMSYFHNEELIQFFQLINSNVID